MNLSQENREAISRDVHAGVRWAAREAGFRTEDPFYDPLAFPGPRLQGEPLSALRIEDIRALAGGHRYGVHRELDALARAVEDLLEERDQRTPQVRL